MVAARVGFWSMPTTLKPTLPFSTANGKPT
jgi:hypothetical protein